MKTISIPVPLALDHQGKALAVPDNAGSWAIKLNTRGRPRQLVTVDGQPLRVPLSATHDDLDAMLGPGHYKLQLLDQAGTPLPMIVRAALGVADEEDEEDRLDEPPALASFPASGSDLRLLLEANVRAMQLSFHHNQRTLETSLRVVDSLRDGVKVLADAQASWIKALADSKSIPPNAPIRNSLPAPEEDEDDEESRDDDQEDVDPDDEDANSPWACVRDISQVVLDPLMPVIAEFARDKLGMPFRNDAGDAPADDESPPRKRAKAPPGPMAMAMLIQKFEQAKQILTPEEVTLMERAIRGMPAEERNQWIAELGPMSIEDAVARIRQAIGTIDVEVAS